MMAKVQHGLAKEDTICVRRGESAVGGLEIWLLITDRELQQREQVARFEEEERAKAADAERANDIERGDRSVGLDADLPDCR